MKAEVMTDYEKIAKNMTVLERQIADRVGEWELRNGKFYDPALHAYVKRCTCCTHLFLAQRSDKKTCSDTCRKKQSLKGLANGRRAGMCF